MGIAIYCAIALIGIGSLLCALAARLGVRLAWRHMVLSDMR